MIPTNGNRRAVNELSYKKGDRCKNRLSPHECLPVLFVNIYSDDSQGSNTAQTGIREIYMCVYIFKNSLVPSINIKHFHGCFFTVSHICK